MNGEPKLVSIYMGPEKEINVFIQGFRAIKSADEFDERVSQILRARPRGRVYLLFFKQNSWSIPRLRKFGWGSFYYTAVRPLPSPIFVSAATGVALRIAVEIAENIGEYIQHEKIFETIGENLPNILRKIPNIKRYPLNLIGHSLGARMIHFALAANDWSAFKLKDCILLGSAADAHDEDWPVCAEEISGKIYNIWSPKDGWLRAANMITFRQRAGRHGILSKHPRIVNKRFRTFGHNDYWPNLEYVLSRAWPNFRQSSNASMAIDSSSCPYCDEDLDIQESGIYECPSCHLDFEVSNGARYTIDNTVPCGWCDIGYYSFTGKNPPNPGDYFTCPSCHKDTWIVESRNHDECA